ncbi:MAG: 50S ribosomal protein L6 [Acidimicrobiales bacterium]
MSRIGSTPILLPSGVEVAVSGSSVEVKGPKGALSHTLPDDITLDVDGDQLTLGRSDDERETKAIHGLTRSLVANMVQGVSEGFSKELEIVGVGYRCQAKGKDRLEFQLGFSHPVHVTAPEGVEFEVPQQTQIIVSGIDKQAVGQVAADIRALKKPEPYKGKGIRYAGEHVMRKAGKAAK